MCISGIGLGFAALVWKTPGYPMVGLLYPYYNYTACVEAMTFAACLGALVTGSPKKTHVNAALLGVMAFCFCMILLAKSRGALMACVFTVIFVLWRKGWQRRLVWGAVAGLAILAFLPPNLAAPWLKLDKPGAYVRPSLWAAAVAVANDHPVFGAGPGLFERGFLLHNFPTPEGVFGGRYGMRTAHAHSEFLQIASEMGWPGLMLFLWAMGGSWSLILKKKNLSWPQEAALAAFSAVFFQTLVDNVLNLPALRWLCFSCLAVASGEVNDTPSSERPALWPRIAYVPGLILAAAAWIPNWAVVHFEGLAYRSSGKTSVHWMRRALALAPGDAGLWEGLARLNLRQSPPNTDAALQALFEASRCDPTNALYPLMRAEVLRSQGKWERVPFYCERALSLEPGFVAARLARAQALCRLGNRNEASDELKRARSLWNPSASTNPPRGYMQMIPYFDVSKYKEVSESVKNGCRGNH